MQKHRKISLLLTLWLYAYSFVWIAFRGLCRLLSPFVKGIAKQINGRKFSKDKLKSIATARNHYDEAVIFYCSSAGEYEQAKPLIDKMQQTHYIHIFFFSISGYQYAQKLNEQNAFDLVPIDTVWDWGKIFKAIRPKNSIIVRHEFWPNFVACAYRYSKIYAIDVSIRQHTSKLSLQVKHWLFKCFDLIFFASEDDVQLMGKISFPYQVVGNTKFERAISRTTERKNTFEKITTTIDNTYPGLKRLIIGSAWKEDIEAALESYTLLPLIEQLNWRIIIAPHDINPKMIQDIISICESKNISHQIYGKSTKADCEALIVAEIGILFELYGCCHAALVGGGFKQGVHNIIEPAIYKIPIVSGPLTGSDREAYTYQKKKLLATVENGKQLRQWWQSIEQNKSFQTQLTEQLQTELFATSHILKELNRTLL